MTYRTRFTVRHRIRRRIVWEYSKTLTIVGYTEGNTEYTVRICPAGGGGGGSHRPPVVCLLL